MTRLDTLLSPALAERFQAGWTALRRPVQVGLAAGLLTALVTLTLPNQYKSEARLLPADARSGGGLGAAAAAAAAVGVSIPGQESADAAYVDILKSRSLREALLQTRFTFQVRTWYFGAEQARQQTLYEYLGKKNLDRAVKALNERISITRDLKTKLLTVAVETESPQLSQQVAQRLVRLLDEFVVSKAQTRGGAKAAFSAKRLAEAREEMAEAEGAFRAYLEGNRNYLMSPDPAVRLKGLRLDSELKLRTQIVTTLAIAREQALLEEKNDMPILNVLDAGNLPIEKNGPGRSIFVAMVAIAGMIVGLAANDPGRIRRLIAFDS
ncbi:MAG: hypothetical protein Q8K67_12670 [Geothrix sp.]|nr:hypothetical protein [Geothrix sp.]